MRIIGWFLVVLGVAGLFWQVSRSGFAAPSGYLYGMADPAGEAAYCLAVAERIREITRETGPPRLEAHVDEQIRFWRSRAGGALAKGRAALARDAAAPGVNEGAHLHLAVQDCGLRAIAFYGHRFASME
ncbi:MAG: hypothetical protein IPL38_19015 [Rhodobacter sp.]|nr:hypothetical protein [Rhodobacter sp.]MBK8441492.1 hypothetical protein [Rhodobacter sp.]